MAHASAAESAATYSLMVGGKEDWEKELTLSEFVRILDKNYEGEDRLRRKLLNDREKHGNNKERPDGIAVNLVDFDEREIFLS